MKRQKDIIQRDNLRPENNAQYSQHRRASQEKQLPPNNSSDYQQDRQGNQFDQLQSQRNKGLEMKENERLSMNIGGQEESSSYSTEKVAPNYEFDQMRQTKNNFYPLKNQKPQQHKQEMKLHSNIQQPYNNYFPEQRQSGSNNQRNQFLSKNENYHSVPQLGRNNYPNLLIQNNNKQEILGQDQNDDIFSGMGNNNSKAKNQLELWEQNQAKILSHPSKDLFKPYSKSWISPEKQNDNKNTSVSQLKNDSQKYYQNQSEQKNNIQYSNPTRESEMIAPGINYSNDLQFQRQLPPNIIPNFQSLASDEEIRQQEYLQNQREKYLQYNYPYYSSPSSHLQDNSINFDKQQPQQSQQQQYQQQQQLFQQQQQFFQQQQQQQQLQVLQFEKELNHQQQNGRFFDNEEKYQTKEKQRYFKGELDKQVAENQKQKELKKKEDKLYEYQQLDDSSPQKQALELSPQKQLNSQIYHARSNVLLKEEVHPIKEGNAALQKKKYGEELKQQMLEEKKRKEDEKLLKKQQDFLDMQKIERQIKEEKDKYHSKNNPKYSREHENGSHLTSNNDYSDQTPSENRKSVGMRDLSEHQSQTYNLEQQMHQNINNLQNNNNPQQKLNSQPNLLPQSQQQNPFLLPAQIVHAKELEYQRFLYEDTFRIQQQNFQEEALIKQYKQQLQLAQKQKAMIQSELLELEIKGNQMINSNLLHSRIQSEPDQYQSIQQMNLLNSKRLLSGSKVSSSFNSHFNSNKINDPIQEKVSHIIDYEPANEQDNNTNSLSRKPFENLKRDSVCLPSNSEFIAIESKDKSILVSNVQEREALKPIQEVKEEYQQTKQNNTNLNNPSNSERETPLEDIRKKSKSSDVDSDYQRASNQSPVNEFIVEEESKNKNERKQERDDHKIIEQQSLIIFNSERQKLGEQNKESTLLFNYNKQNNDKQDDEDLSDNPLNKTQELPHIFSQFQEMEKQQVLQEEQLKLQQQQKEQFEQQQRKQQQQQQQYPQASQVVFKSQVSPQGQLNLGKAVPYFKVFKSHFESDDEVDEQQDNSNNQERDFIIEKQSNQFNIQHPQNGEEEEEEEEKINHNFVDAKKRDEDGFGQTEISEIKSSWKDSPSMNQDNPVILMTKMLKEHSHQLQNKSQDSNYQFEKKERETYEDKSDQKTKQMKDFNQQKQINQPDQERFHNAGLSQQKIGTENNSFVQQKEEEEAENIKNNKMIKDQLFERKKFLEDNKQQQEIKDHQNHHITKHGSSRFKGYLSQGDNNSKVSQAIDDDDNQKERYYLEKDNENDRQERQFENSSILSQYENNEDFRSLKRVSSIKSQIPILNELQKQDSNLSRKGFQPLVQPPSNQQYNGELVRQKLQEFLEGSQAKQQSQLAEDNPISSSQLKVQKNQSKQHKEEQQDHRTIANKDENANKMLSEENNNVNQQSLITNSNLYWSSNLSKSNLSASNNSNANNDKKISNYKKPKTIDVFAKKGSPKLNSINPPNHSQNEEALSQLNQKQQNNFNRNEQSSAPNKFQRKEIAQNKEFSQLDEQKTLINQRQQNHKADQLNKKEPQTQINKITSVQNKPSSNQGSKISSKSKQTQSEQQESKNDFNFFTPLGEYEITKGKNEQDQQKQDSNIRANQFSNSEILSKIFSPNKLPLDELKSIIKSNNSYSAINAQSVDYSSSSSVLKEEKLLEDQKQLQQKVNFPSKIKQIKDQYSYNKNFAPKKQEKSEIIINRLDNLISSLEDE